MLGVGKHRGFRANLLGRFGLEGADGSSLLPPSRKQQAIMAYLLYNLGKAVNRQDLVELIWPDSPVENGLGSLRAALHKLRRLLSETGQGLMVSDRNSISVDMNLCEVDLWDRDGQITLRKAGPLLDRLDPVAPLFDEWLEHERRFIAARQVARAEAVLNAPDADIGYKIKAAETLLQIDPGHEVAAQAHMKNLNSIGQTSKAIQVYKCVKASLDSDGFALSAETERVFQSLKMRPDSSLARPILNDVPTPRQNRVPLVAVTPLRIHSQNPDHRFLSSVLAEEISSRLTNLREVRVLGANVCARLRDGDLDPSSYGVNYVLNGSIAELEGQFRVSLQLTSVNSQVDLWSRSAEFAAGKLSGELTKLTDAVAATIVPKVEEREHSLLAHDDTGNEHAYFHYLQGKMMFYAAKRHAEMEMAMEHLERAIQLDPNFSPAYVNLVQALNTGAFLTAPGTDLDAPRAKALRLAEKLLALDAHNASGHIAWAWCLMWRKNFELAERSLERAMELKPLQSDRLNSIGTALVYLGRHDEGEEYYRISRERQVQEQDYFSDDLIELYFFKRDYDEARKWLRRGSQRWPYYGLLFKAAVLAQLGELSDARRAGDESLKMLKMHWRGAAPFNPQDGLRWCLEVTPLSRDEDRDILLEGLSKAGLKL